MPFWTDAVEQKKYGVPNKRFSDCGKKGTSNPKLACQGRTELHILHAAFQKKHHPWSAPPAGKFSADGDRWAETASQPVSLTPDLV